MGFLEKGFIEALCYYFCAYILPFPLVCKLDSLEFFFLIYVIYGVCISRLSFLNRANFVCLLLAAQACVNIVGIHS